MTDAIPFAADIWQRLPIVLRRRYWSETNYGRKRPSKALWDEMQEAAAKIKNGDAPPVVEEDDDVI